MVSIGISVAWPEEEVREAGAILLLLTSPLVPLLQGARGVRFALSEKYWAQEAHLPDSFSLASQSMKKPPPTLWQRLSS